jgi:ribosomal protein L16 Arg81 hydroxylase
MSDGPQHAWDKLLFPIQSHDFDTKYFEKKYLHISRSNKDHYSNLFSRQEVEKLLNEKSFRFPALRLTKHGEEIQSSEYCTDKFVDMVQVRKRFSEGYTIILNSVHEQHAALKDMTNDLSVHIGHPFQTNVYITPSESQGFPAHYDTHDVFVLQVTGNKTWRIYSNSSTVLPSKTMEFNAKEHHPGTEFKEIRLKQGDLLYLPRGVFHDALAESELSIHVTLGMLNYTWTDLIIQSVLERAKFNPEWRKSLPANYSSKSIQQENQLFFSTLLEDLSKNTDLELAFHQFRKNLLRNLPTPVSNILDSAQKINNIDLGTWVQHQPYKPFSLKKTAENISIDWAGYQVSFPAHTETTLTFVIQHQRFQLDTLPDDMDEASKLVLIKRLLNEDFLQIVEGP